MFKVLLVLVAVSLLLLPVVYSESETIGLWLFDEGSGDTAADSSPMGNDGALADGVQWVEGMDGSAIEVGGAGMDVTIPMIDIYNQQDFTFECWVYPLSVIPQQYNQIIIAGRGEWGGDDPSAFQLSITLVDDVPQARWFLRIAGAWETVTGGPELEPETWYHFAGTLEDGQKASLYVNGEEAATGNLAAKLVDNTHPIYVGSWGPAEDPLSAYHGYIDELRYSDEVLGPDQLGFAESRTSVEPAEKLSTLWGTIKTR